MNFKVVTPVKQRATAQRRRRARFATPALATLLAVCLPAFGCDPEATAVFGCEAARGRNFIELCAPAASTGPEAGALQYRFGSLDGAGREKTVELEFPHAPEGSLRQFFGATYTYECVYTQSIRFLSGGYSYTVFTRTRGTRLLGAGVDVLNQATGKTRTVDCSERPRFYIFELQGRVPCDPETPVGRACIR
jgi:hypothetical protein